jgi:hypothetical protein
MSLLNDIIESGDVAQLRQIIEQNPQMILKVRISRLWFFRG